PSISTYRKPTADHFAVGNQIGPKSKHLCHPAQSDAKSGNDFVKNDEAAVRSGDVHSFFDKLAALNQQPVIRWQRLQNNRGNLVTVLGKNRSDVFFIIQRSYQRFTCNSI